MIRRTRVHVRRNSIFCDSLTEAYINEWMVTIVKFIISNKMFTENNVLLKQ